MTFDRADFEAKKADMLAGQAQDGELFDLGREFIIKSDRHGYAYQWTWCGLPIIQMPQDVLAVHQCLEEATEFAVDLDIHNQLVMSFHPRGYLRRV